MLDSGHWTVEVEQRWVVQHAEGNPAKENKEHQNKEVKQDGRG